MESANISLKSSWISHLPTDITFSRVSGLGMNEAGLLRNPRLNDFVVHDLNFKAILP